MVGEVFCRREAVEGMAREEFVNLVPDDWVLDDLDIATCQIWTISLSSTNKKVFDHCFLSSCLSSWYSHISYHQPRSIVRKADKVFQGERLWKRCPERSSWISFGQLNFE